MKIKQLRELTNEEISRKAGELKHDSLNLRVQQASGQLENPARLKSIRREVAQLETILSERRLNLPVPAAAAKAAPAKAKKATAKTKKASE